MFAKRTWLVGLIGTSIGFGPILALPLNAALLPLAIFGLVISLIIHIWYLDSITSEGIRKKKVEVVEDLVEGDVSEEEVKEFLSARQENPRL